MYSVHRLDGFPPAPHDMRFSPFHASRLNCDMRFLPHQSPLLSYRFLAPSHRRTLCDSPCRAPIRLDWTQCHRLHPRVPFPIGGESQLTLLAPLPLSVQSASRLPPRLAFRRAARCLRSFVQMSWEDACFSRTYPFSTSIPPRHVIHYPIYMRAWWNGRHARFRFWWRNPCGFESHRPHHGNVQPASAARSGSRGGGLFHAAETKIQSIRFRYERNGRAASGT